MVNSTFGDTEFIHDIFHRGRLVLLFSDKFTGASDNLLSTIFRPFTVLAMALSPYLVSSVQRRSVYHIDRPPVMNKLKILSNIRSFTGIAKPCLLVGARILSRISSFEHTRGISLQIGNLIHMMIEILSGYVYNCNNNYCYTNHCYANYYIVEGELS